MGVGEVLLDMVVNDVASSAGWKAGDCTDRMYTRRLEGDELAKCEEQLRRGLEIIAEAKITLVPLMKKKLARMAAIWRFLDSQHDYI